MYSYVYHGFVSKQNKISSIRIHQMMINHDKQAIALALHQLFTNKTKERNTKEEINQWYKVETNKTSDSVDLINLALNLKLLIYYPESKL